ncbi:hypothetical protein L0F63_000850 [Massospora cicadina]|nr:hypothetical protein L0F63_000850 [Massospora cicadina]
MSIGSWRAGSASPSNATGRYVPLKTWPTILQALSAAINEMTMAVFKPASYIDFHPFKG